MFSIYLSSENLLVKIKPDIIKRGLNFFTVTERLKY